MANPEHLAILKQGVEVWNRWRATHPEVIPDLDEADLRSMGFGRINFGCCRMPEVDLRDSNCYGASFIGARLMNSDLRGADLTEADFVEAVLQDSLLDGAALAFSDLTMADLTGVELYGTDLEGAVLAGTDFSKAVFGRTKLLNASLRSVRGLETCAHIGPSYLDIRTLAQSGPLSVSFLRGCGLPDVIIDYLPSLLSEPIQFYSCFISYSSKDQDFADRLHADLQNRGVRCWFAPHDVRGGRKLHEQIEEAIRVYDRLLLILSEASMNSEWVKTEITNARQRELREKRQMLFPISLVPFENIGEWKAFDPDTGKDSAREIREYFIPDFSNWKAHESYQTAFQRLLRDLKAKGNTMPGGGS